MRLFIAANFDSRTKSKMAAAQKKLAEYADGRFTHPDNIHLTLIFLGQIQPQLIGDIEKAMQSVSFHPMNITFSHVGHFTRRNRDIWWIGINKNSELIRLQKELVESLSLLGFSFQEQPFIPHITLARQVKASKPINKEGIFKAPFSTKIDSISLINSHRVDNKLTYTEISKASAL